MVVYIVFAKLEFAVTSVFHYAGEASLVSDGQFCMRCKNRKKTILIKKWICKPLFAANREPLRTLITKFDATYGERLICFDPLLWARGQTRHCVAGRFSYFTPHRHWNAIRGQTRSFKNNYYRENAGVQSRSTAKRRVLIRIPKWIRTNRSAVGDPLSNSIHGNKKWLSIKS